MRFQTSFILYKVINILPSALLTLRCYLRSWNLSNRLNEKKKKIQEVPEATLTSDLDDRFS